MSATTIYCKNEWRWLICSLGGAVKTNLDKLATNQSIQYVLDDTSQFTCDLPSDNEEINRHANDGAPVVSHLRRLVYGLRREEPTDGSAPWQCRFSGILTIPQDQASSDEPVTHITANDSMNWTKALPVLTPSGYLLSEKGYTYKNKTGNYIAKDVIANAYTWINSQNSFSDGSGGPPYVWGHLHEPANYLFIDISSGNFDTTDIIPNFPIQQGASVYDVWQQLCQTGGLDIVLDPIYKPRDKPGQLSVMNVYAQAGTDQHGAVFGWDMFPRNLVGFDDLLDGTQAENWVQFFAGGLVAAHHISQSSIDAFGPYFAQKNITQGDKDAVSLLALAEVALRKNGKQTLTIDPTPELSPDPFTRYFLGDTVRVWAGRDLSPVSDGLASYATRRRVASDQTQTPSPWRVYGFQVDLADDQVETITNLLLTDPNTSNI